MKEYLNPKKAGALTEEYAKVPDKFNQLLEAVWMPYQNQKLVREMDVPKAGQFFSEPARFTHSHVCSSLTAKGMEVAKLPNIAEFRQLVEQSGFAWYSSKKFYELGEVLDFSLFDFKNGKITFGERGKRLIREHCTHRISDTEFELLSKLEVLETDYNECFRLITELNLKSCGVNLLPLEFVVIQNSGLLKIDQRKIKLLLK